MQTFLLLVSIKIFNIYVYSVTAILTLLYLLEKYTQSATCRSASENILKIRSPTFDKSFSFANSFLIEFIFNLYEDGKSHINKWFLEVHFKILHLPYTASLLIDCTVTFVKPKKIILSWIWNQSIAFNFFFFLLHLVTSSLLPNNWQKKISQEILSSYQNLQCHCGLVLENLQNNSSFFFKNINSFNLEFVTCQNAPYKQV